MLRHVMNDLYQVGHSAVGKDGWCEAVRVYVLLNNGFPLVFDTGSNLHTHIVMDELKEVLQGTPPAFVFLTHTELPHTGNLGAIFECWPDVKLVVSSAILPHVELPWWVKPEHVKYAYAGTREVYGGREISFSDGILKDQPGTHWMFDTQTGTLFTADAFGYNYPSLADSKFDDELADGIPVDWFRRYHESAFRFLPLVSGEKVNADIEKVFAKREVRIVAPTHGNAIRADLPQCVDRVKQSILEICA